MASAIINHAKWDIENERSLWDRIVDFFMSKIDVYNKYNKRLSERITQIVQTILQDNNCVSISKDEYHIKIPALLDLNLRLPEEQKKDCGFLDNVSRVISALLKLSQPPIFDENFLATSGRQGSIKSQMMWWDDNNGLVHQQAMVEQVFEDGKLLGYQDGTYFYYEDDSLSFVCSEVMAYCLQHNLRPIASKFFPPQLADTTSVYNFIYCKTNHSPRISFSTHENYSFISLELPSLDYTREQLSGFVSNYVELLKNLDLQNERTTFRIERTKVEKDVIFSDTDIEQDIKVLTGNNAFPCHLLSDNTLPTDNGTHLLLIEIQVTPATVVDYSVCVSSTCLNSLRSYIDSN
ncbi:hypothetical protein RCN09_17430, partial [Escherichia marmotae]|nr:hypothetical protein [Escherichia marmotae]